MYFSEINLLSPEIALLIAICFILVLKTFIQNNIIINYTCIIACLIPAFIILSDNHFAYRFLFERTFVTNGLIYAAKFFTLILTAVILFSYNSVLRSEYNRTPILQILMLFSLLGTMVLLSANDLLILYIGLELQSLALYSLAAINRNNIKSSEAGLKYFVLGAVASAILLYGASLIYGYIGTMRFDLIADYAFENSKNMYSVPLGVIIGFILIIISMLFKVAAVPFHMWAPDVYEGSSTIVTTYFATVSKVASGIVLIRLLFEPFAAWYTEIDNIIYIIAVISIILGSFGAIMQKNIKRMLAYSSIGHIGFIILGIACFSASGIKSILIYFIIYSITALGTFLAVMINARRIDRTTYNIHDLILLSKSDPVLAFSLMIFMLSMAGIPPVAGFFAKFNIIISAIDAKLYLIAIIAVIANVAAAYYYLNIIKIIYFDEPRDMQVKTYNTGMFEMKFIVIICMLLNLAYIIIPNEIFEYLNNISKLLF